MEMLPLGAMMVLCLLVFAAGFVDAVAGGGGLISLPAYLVTGLPVHVAYGCNKFSSACGTTLSTLRFWRSKTMDVQTALLAAVGAFAGSAGAARIVLLLSEQALRAMLLVLLPCAMAVIFLNKGREDDNRSQELSQRRRVALALAIGVGIGFYDGLFGPGTGTFAIIAFSLLMKYDLRTASGNAKLLNLASNYAAVITFMIAGSVNYAVALPAALCGVAGNYLGAGLAIRRGARFIRPMMALVLALLSVRILWDALH